MCMETKQNDKSVLVLGASTKPSRYSNKAIIALRSKGFIVYAIGRSAKEKVSDVEIQNSFKDLGKEVKIHTISMYLNEANQTAYEEDIIKLKPNRVIFNPGAENIKLYRKLNEKGIETLNACTLVMLSVGNF